MDDEDWDLDVDLEIFLKAMKLCCEDAKGETGIQGNIACPQCGGKLNYSIAKLNGHLWGKCETENCLSWMQ